MDFGLSDEQLALQATAHRFAEDEIVPIASEYDASGEFPMHVMKKAYEIGLSHVTIPSDYDGVGLSMLDTVIVTEEISWGCAGIATSLMGNDLGLGPILVAGSLKGGRHIRYKEATPLANVHLSLLGSAGVHLDRFADSTGPVEGLFRS